MLSSCDGGGEEGKSGATGFLYKLWNFHRYVHRRNPTKTLAIVINALLVYSRASYVQGFELEPVIRKMAEKALKKVEDQLDCSICLETYTDPKLLQCLHVFCRKCLVKLVDRDQQGQLILTCPICRQDTPVPANGTAGLQPAFHIVPLLEIAEELKKATVDLHVPASAERVSTSLTPAPDKIRVSCPDHEKAVELHCKKCEEPICYKCLVTGAKHQGHDCEELNTAFERYKGEMTASLGPMEQQLTTVNKALAQFERHCGEISDQQAAIEADVHKQFTKLRKILDVRETEVINQLHQLTQRKLKSLAVQRDQIETLQARLGSCIGFVRESLETGRQAEVLMMKTAVVKQVKELSTTFSSDLLEPSKKADMIFSAPTTLVEACQRYGQVSESVSPDPLKCCATGKGTEAAVVGETATALLQAIDFRSQPCEEPILSLECELVSELTGVRTQGSVERKGQSQYEISYQPTVKGRHQLHIKVEGQHIRGSPFSIAARLSINSEELGTPIQMLVGVRKPWGVAVNKRGEMVVTERDACRVSVFNASGEKLRSFGSHGTGQGQFLCILGVTTDGEGNILVGDNGNHRIQKFTSEGQFLAAVGTEGRGPLQFHGPGAIAFNAVNNKLYVVDSHCIQVLNSDLTFSNSFGREGRGKGQFDHPWYIACDRTGKVYVSDFGNHRVQVFTAEGKFLRMFGKYGGGRGELNFPIGVAVDSSDMVYVSDQKNHRVSVFTTEGVFVTSFGSPGGHPGEFVFPRGLCVDNSGVVYVCDYTNNRVQIF